MNNSIKNVMALLVLVLGVAACNKEEKAVTPPPAEISAAPEAEGDVESFEDVELQEDEILEEIPSENDDSEF